LNTDYARWFFNDLSDTYGPLNLLFVSSSTDGIRKCILSGMAISFIPDYCMINDPDILNGEIVPITIKDYDAAKVSLGWLSSKEKPPSIPACKFMEYLNTEFHIELKTSRTG